MLLVFFNLANHRNIFTLAGFEVEEYPYWNAERRGLDYEAMLDTMRAAPEGSVFVIHACAHNPTGESINSYLFFPLKKTPRTVTLYVRLTNSFCDIK